MKTSVIMFDFGNVIAFFDFTIAFSKLVGSSGPADRMLSDPVSDPDVRALAGRFERGRIGPEEFARDLLALLGVEMPYDEFAAAWSDIFTLNEPVGRVVAELKQGGYTLLLGSNTNILHAPFYRRKFRAVLDHFDHFVFSHDVGEMKPGEEFFRACVGAVNVPANECIFIDDIPENIAGAERLGLRGIVYREPGQLVDELRRHGVEVGRGQA